MIQRDLYLNRLISLKDTEFIKVVTGVRRSGKSTLLKLYQEHLLQQGIKNNQVLFLNFESAQFDHIKTYKDLYNFVKERIHNTKTYLLLDEVQNIASWEKAINSFQVDFNIDIYLTGSNAYVLSSELSTLLSGRYIEIKMYTLSFKEYLLFKNHTTENLEQPFYEYLKFGGFPAINSIENNPSLVLSYLQDIYNSIVKKDILDRSTIKNAVLLENIIKYLVANIGSPISSTKITNYLQSNKIVNKTNNHTIDNYLSLLEKSYIMYKAQRTDIKSKAVLKTLGKYYVSDMGIRNIVLGYRNIEEGYLLENVVYLELLRRGYLVSVGKIGEYEVDFVAETPHEVTYYQVTQTLQSSEVKARELRSLESISNNYKKIILTMDKTINNDINGIQIQYLPDWLLS